MRAKNDIIISSWRTHSTECWNDLSVNEFGGVDHFWSFWDVRVLRCKYGVSNSYVYNPVLRVIITNWHTSRVSVYRWWIRVHSRVGSAHGRLTICDLVFEHNLWSYDRVAIWSVISYCGKCESLCTHHTIASRSGQERTSASEEKTDIGTRLYSWSLNTRKNVHTYTKKQRDTCISYRIRWSKIWLFLKCYIENGGFEVAEFVFQVMLTVTATNKGPQGQEWENFRIFKHCFKYADFLEICTKSV